MIQDRYRAIDKLKSWKKIRGIGRKNFVEKLVFKHIEKFNYQQFINTFETLGDLRDLSVINIGCGSGVFVSECINRGAAFVTGMDNNLDSILLANERLSYIREKGRFVLIQDLFPTIKIMTHDYAIVCGSISDEISLTELLYELRNLVTIGALILFPPKNILLNLMHKFRWKGKDLSALNYNADSLIRLADSSDFSKVEIRKIGKFTGGYNVMLYI